MIEIVKALIKARKSFQPIVKDKYNPHYKSQYASLDAVIEAVEEGLSSNGLVVTQVMGFIDGKAVLKTLLYHESGEMLESNYPLPDIADPQKLGGAVTYARRYALCGILGVVADEDDDGNAASVPNQKPSGNNRPAASQPKAKTPATAHQNGSAPKANPASNGFITGEQRKELGAIATSTGFTIPALKAMLATMGYESSEVIPVSAFPEVCKHAANKELVDQWNEYAASQQQPVGAA